MKITLALQSIDSFLVGSGLEDSNGTLAIDTRPGMVSMPETVYLLSYVISNLGVVQPCTAWPDIYTCSIKYA